VGVEDEEVEEVLVDVDLVASVEEGHSVTEKDIFWSLELLLELLLDMLHTVQ
jgi:hypothetical protein